MDNSDEEKSSLGHVPANSRWEFSEDVVDCFDDMLRRSIPQYDVMRDVVHALAVKYAQPGTGILDLGCSRGEALARLHGKLGDGYRYVGIDSSEPMVMASKRRFEGTDVEIERFDLKEGYPNSYLVSVTLAVLSLQFIPINYRQRIVSDMYDHTMKNGVAIVVEKVLGSGPRVDSMMVDLYHAKKLDYGYSKEEIMRKKLSLEGVLVPVTAEWNEQLLRRAGFREVDCVWRWMNFAAWIALK